jgi:YHS domain-containing protein
MGASTCPAGAAAAAAAWAGDPYTLSTDPVTGAALGDHPVVYQYEGRELRFADAHSLDQFKAHPQQYLPAVDQKMVAQQAPYYPLDVCMISGEKLGAMGPATDVIYKNRLVRFCCPGCPDTFKKDPAKFIARLDQAAIARQRAAYPLNTCLVSGDRLGGDMGQPREVVVGGRLVRLCCPGCVAEFNKNPAKYLHILDNAVAEKSAGGKTTP